MKKIIFLFICSMASFVLSATAQDTKTTTENNKDTSIAKAPDGLSITKAIFITETTEGKGVNAEYAWIKAHYSNYKIKSQSLSYNNKKPYDIVTIIQQDSTELKLYFDISNYFGKF